MADTTPSLPQAVLTAKLRAHAERHVDCATGQAELIAIADELAAQEPSAAAEPVGEVDEIHQMGKVTTYLRRLPAGYDLPAGTKLYANPPTPPSAPAGAGEGERLTASELRFAWETPEVLALLMDYHDVQQDAADSMDMPCHGNRDRAEVLRKQAVSIIAHDPEIWSPDVRERFEPGYTRPSAPPSHEGEDARDAVPQRPGVYVWQDGTSFALVLVNKRPSAISPGGVLNGHIIDSTRFYDGSPVDAWAGAGARWTLLHDFDAARAGDSQ